MLTSPGQLLVNDALPEDLRRPQWKLDKRGITELFSLIAQRYPDKYRDIAQNLMSGGHFAAQTAGTTLRLADLLPPPQVKDRLEALRNKVQGIAAQNLPREQRDKLIVDTVMKDSDGLESLLMEHGLSNNNNLATQVASGSRGNPTQFKQLVAGDMLVADHRNRVIPVPVLHGYANGVDPAEYFAAAYGARRGTISTKFCLDQDTLVLMADHSHRKIKDVQVGDVVMGSDYQGRIRPTTVTAKWENGIKPVWTYTFRPGKSHTASYEITATEDHQVLACTRAGKRCSKPVGLYPLRESSRVGFQLLAPSGEVGNRGRTEPRAHLLGLLIGDGGLSGSSIYLSSGDPALIDCVNTEYADAGFKLTPVRNHPYEYILKNVTGTRPHPLKAWLSTLNLLGKLAHQKHVPQVVWQWNKQSIAAFIAGLFESDGCVSRTNYSSTPKITLAMTARHVVETTRRLLWIKFGIHTSQVRTSKAARNGNFPVHYITINKRRCVQRFADLIPLNGAKAAKLETAVAHMKPEVRDDGFGFSFVSKRFAGDQPTYDIEVEHPDHLFVLANGFIVSNSTQQAGWLGKQLAMVAHRLVVSEHDCGTTTGLPVPGGDTDNIGAVLARDTGSHKAGTIITPEMVSDLKGQKILVRSPTTCQASRGVCAKCAGVREKGKLPDVGENVGMAAAQAVSEPLAQSSLCLAEGTSVRMADSTERAIEQIKPGDWVLGADCTGRAFPVRVKRVFDNGRRACYRTTFRVGTQHNAQATQLVSTLDHKILMTTAYTNCRNAQFNDVPRVLPVGFKNKRVSAVYPSQTRFTCNYSDSRALLLGLLLGDGCYTKAVGRPHFSCADPKLIQELTSYLQSLNLKLTFHKGSTCYWNVSQIVDEIRQDAKTGRTLSGARNPAKRMLQELGIDGKYAHEKEIPDQFMRADQATTAALIAGLWITDGSVYLTEKGNRLHLGFTSTSSQLIRQLKWLLQWRFGIYSADIHYSPASQNKTRKHDVYSFAIARQDAVRRFAELIPLKGVKAERLQRWADRLQSADALTHQRGTRTSQVYVGELATYDIEVEHPDHLFVLANGLIVSNSEKHSGGAVTKRAASTSGFDYINRLIQTPKQFSGSAVVANKDGRITEIADAPQGGKFVYVDNEKHYVPPGEDLTVKPGDKLDAGDLLSEGVPNPADVVQHKGIGEGRRSFTFVLAKALADSGIKAHRRNVEMLSRGLINHVTWQGEDAAHHVLPDDVVPYDNVSRSYRPRSDAVTLRPKQAVGSYLEHPALHYSIGTKITPRVADELDEFSVDQVVAHPQPPPFLPTMVHGREVGLKDPNWITRMGSSYLQKGFLEGVHRSRVAPTSDTSFYPSLAKTKGFGNDLSKSGTY